MSEKETNPVFEINDETYRATEPSGYEFDKILETEGVNPNTGEVIVGNLAEFNWRLIKYVFGVSEEEYKELPMDKRNDMLEVARDYIDLE